MFSQPILFLLNMKCGASKSAGIIIARSEFFFSYIPLESYSAASLSMRVFLGEADTATYWLAFL